METYRKILIGLFVVFLILVSVVYYSDVLEIERHTRGIIVSIFGSLAATFVLLFILPRYVFTAWIYYGPILYLIGLSFIGKIPVDAGAFSLGRAHIAFGVGIFITVLVLVIGLIQIGFHYLRNKSHPPA